MEKKINYNNLLPIIFSFMAMCLLSILIILNEDFVVTMKNDVINVGEHYQDSFTATFKGHDVTKNVKVQSNIYDTDLGKYQVTFTYINGNKEYKVVKTVEIKDLDAPNIELYGGKELIYKTNEQYVEQGARAIDNYDGNVSSNIIIDGNVDTSKVGKYQVTYSIKDSSNNKAKKVRTVYVLDKTPLEQSVSEFTLNGLFEDTILKQKKKSISDNKLNEIVFIGDNDVSLFSTYGLVKISNIWYSPKLNLNNIDEVHLNIDGKDTKLSTYENILTNKPKTVILCFGLKSYNSVDDYISKYGQLVTKLKDNTDSRIVVMSLNMTYNDTLISAKEINNINYLLAKMCSENEVEFLNSTEVLKNRNESNYLSDGYTLSKVGQTQIFNYIKLHI